MGAATPRRQPLPPHLTHPSPPPPPLPQAGAAHPHHPDAECGVCLGRLGERGPPARLPCAHSFCGPCVGRWLAACHDTCPTCRFRFAAADTEPVKEM